MRLKNKKTGEIGLVHCDATMFSNKIGVFIDNNHIDLRNPYKIYTSLAELNEEWEDYEEPKEYWYIDPDANIDYTSKDDEYDDEAKQIGNYFNTREEAELAVRKLKAWKRLKDKGFRPRMWEWEYIYDDNISGELTIKAHIDDATDSDGKYTKDLDLLFSGGEE